MKRNDWAAVVLIVGIVALASYFILGQVLPSPNTNPTKVPTAATISATVVPPSRKVFNEDAINPTVKSYIGDQSDERPFSIGDN